jgi:hypothetical protein
MPVTKGNYVAGWYGFFTEYKLKGEILPDLADLVAKGKHYPFLITSHRLNASTDVIFFSENVKSRKDFKFSPRQRDSRQIWEAVVMSQNEHQLINHS